MLLRIREVRCVVRKVFVVLASVGYCGAGRVCHSIVNASVAADVRKPTAVLTGTVLCSQAIAILVWHTAVHTVVLACHHGTDKEVLPSPSVQKHFVAFLCTLC